MKKFFNKNVFLTVLVMVLFISFIACGDKQAGESNKISIWAWDPNFNIAIMEEAKERYLKINPNVEFEIVDLAKSDLEQKLLTNLSSGLTSGLPDIVLVEDYNAQKYLSSFPGAFADLSDSIDYSKFLSYKKALATVDGKTYSVPFDTGVSAMFYRSDYLQAAGYSEADLQNITWDEYIEIGKKVKAATGKAFLTTDFYEGGLLRVMMQSAGGWYYRNSQSPDLANNKALVEALKTYKKIHDAGIAQKTTGWAAWVGPVNAGDVATITTGVWIIGTVKSETSQSGKWKVAPTPRLSVAGSVNASNLGGSSWYVLETAQNKALAIDFLQKTYASDVDFYQKILVDKGAVGSFIPAASGDAYTVADPFFGGQKAFADLAKWAQQIPNVNYGAYTYEYDAAIFAEVPGIIDGSVDIKTALTKAQDTALAQIQ